MSAVEGEEQIHRQTRQSRGPADPDGLGNIVYCRGPDHIDIAFFQSVYLRRMILLGLVNRDVLIDRIGIAAGSNASCSRDMRYLTFVRPGDGA